VSRVLKRDWSSAEGWRDTKAGMWAWLIQRAAAVALLLVIALHLANPFRRGTQAALLALVLIHALLGVRAILLDFPRAPLAPGAVRARDGAGGDRLRGGLGVEVVLSRAELHRA
jgi:succinate dehydrogenase hydrophobic anchor subunit